MKSISVCKTMKDISAMTDEDLVHIGLEAAYNAESEGEKLIAYFVGLGIDCEIKRRKEPTEL